MSTWDLRHDAQLALRAQRFDQVVKICQALFAEGEPVSNASVARQLGVQSKNFRIFWISHSHTLRAVIYGYQKLQKELKLPSKRRRKT